MINLSSDKCVGCQACAMICHKSAIEMVISDGFAYPQINMDKCVDCHLCEKVCPAENELNNNYYSAIRRKKQMVSSHF